MDKYCNKCPDINDMIGRTLLSGFCLQLLNMELVLLGHLLLPGIVFPHKV